MENPQPKERRKVLYDALYSKQLYTKTFTDFENQFATTESQDKLYNKMVADGLLDAKENPKDYFMSSFSDLQKKNLQPTESGIGSQAGLPSQDVPIVENGFDDKVQKNTEEINSGLPRKFQATDIAGGSMQTSKGAVAHERSIPAVTKESVLNRGDWEKDAATIAYDKLPEEEKKRLKLRGFSETEMPDIPAPKRPIWALSPEEEEFFSEAEARAVPQKTKKEYEFEVSNISKDNERLNVAINEIDKSLIKKYGENFDKNLQYDIARIQSLSAEQQQADILKTKFPEEKLVELQGLVQKTNQIIEDKDFNDYQNLATAINANNEKLGQIQKGGGYNNVREILNIQESTQKYADQKRIGKGKGWSGVTPYIMRSTGNLISSIGATFEIMENMVGDKKVGTEDVIQEYLMSFADEAEARFPAPTNLKRPFMTRTKLVRTGDMVSQIDYDDKGEIQTVRDEAGYIREPISASKVIDALPEAEVLDEGKKFNFKSGMHAAGQALVDLIPLMLTTKGISAGVGAALSRTTFSAATKANIASKVGLISAVTAQMAQPLYEEALAVYGDTEEGRQKASMFALVTGIGIGSINTLFGLEERIATGQKGFLDKFMRSNKFSELKARIAAGNGTWKDFTIEALKGAAVSGVGESIEEGVLENALKVGTSHFFNQFSDKKLDTHLSYDDVINDGAVGFAAGFLGVGYAPKTALNEIMTNAYYVAATNPDKFAGIVNAMAQAGQLKIPAGTKLTQQEFAEKIINETQKLGKQIELVGDDAYEKVPQLIELNNLRSKEANLNDIGSKAAAKVVKEQADALELSIFNQKADVAPEPTTDQPSEVAPESVQQSTQSEPTSELAPINVTEVAPPQEATNPEQTTEVEPTTHKQKIHENFRKEFESKGVGGEQIDGAIALMEARAKSWASEEEGRNPDDWYNRIADVKGGEFQEQTSKQYQLSDGRTGVTQPDVVNGFYSPLEKIIGETKFEKLPAKQWIEKFSTEEAKWTGLSDWLSKQEGSVSKADIQKFLKNNRVEVVEVVKGKTEWTQKNDKTWERETAKETPTGRKVKDGKVVIRFIDGKYIGEPTTTKFAQAFNSLEEAKSYYDSSDVLGGGTKFSDYQLAGEKENYKEVLVVMPSKSGGFELMSNEQLAKEYENQVGYNPFEEGNTREEIINLLQSNEGVKEKGMKFKSSHFDEPNILIHLRMNTRTDTDGNKVLFLEEIQSDWGQKGKKEGFAISDTERASYEKERQANIKRRIEIIEEQKQIGAENKKYWDLQEEHDKLRKEGEKLSEKSFSKGQPSAPFVTDTNAWVKLGLKVALKEAVKQGATKIAWTTGEQQNDRYDLSKQVDEIGWQKNENGTYSITPKKDGDVVRTRNIMANLTLKQVEDYVGKDIAQKIENEEGKVWDGGKVKQGKLKGQQLQVGGKGMKGFYGSPAEGGLGIVGNVAKSLFKQEPKTVEIESGEKGKFYDELRQKEIRIEEIAHEQSEVEARLKSDKGSKSIQAKQWNDLQEEKTNLIQEVKDIKRRVSDRLLTFNTSTQHSIDITTELKKQVEQGLPLFQKDATGTAKGAVETLADGRKVIHALTSPDFSTMVHELAHVFEGDLTESEKKIVKDFGGSEAFARGFEKYLRDGKAPNSQLKDLFSKFKTWLTDIYKFVKGSPIEKKVTPGIKQIFDRLLTEVAPEQITEEQITQEQFIETDDLLNGGGEQIRKEGKYTKDGVEYVRNEKGGGEKKGNSGEVRFTNEVALPFTYKLVEAETLQPSHQNGIRNPKHFIPEAQPKSRSDQGSLQAEESFATEPRFEELGENTNAYSGAPVVNERNEVIQGNNRSAGLKKGYRAGNQKYKEDLAANAEKFGFTADQVNGMTNPILVREVAASDEGAIELGNYDVKDLESGGKRRLDPVALTRRMPFNVKGKIADVLFRGDDTLNQAIRNNIKLVMDLINPYLNTAQRNTIFKDGKLTEAGIKDLEAVVQHFMFDNSHPDLPALFEELSHVQKEGLRKSLPYIFSTEAGKSIVPEVQEAIIALNHFVASNAGSFDTWKVQGDMFNEGRTPSNIYTPTALAIAKMLHEANTQKEVAQVFAQYASEANGTQGDMFAPAKEGVSKKEAIKNVFKTTYNEKPKEVAGSDRMADTDTAAEAIPEIEAQTAKKRAVKKEGKDFQSEVTDDDVLEGYKDELSALEKVDPTNRRIEELNNELNLPNADFTAGFDINKIGKYVELAYLHIKNGVKTAAQLAKKWNTAVSEMIMNIFQAGVRMQIHLDSDNYNSEYHFLNYVMRSIQDKTRLLGVTQKELTQLGLTDADPHGLMELYRSKAENAFKVAYEKIVGRPEGKFGAKKVNQSSLMGRIGKLMGMTNDQAIEFAGTYFHALHGKERNQRVREIVQKRIDEAVAHLNAKIKEEAAKPVPNQSTLTMWQNRVDELLNTPLPEKGSGYTDAEADAILAAHASKATELEAFFREFQKLVTHEYVNVLYEGGLIDSDTRDQMINGEREGFTKFDFYVPLEVKADDYESMNLPALLSSSAPIKGIIGTDKYDADKRYNPVAKAISDLHKAHHRAEKNKVALEVAKMIDQAPTARKWSIVKSKSTPGRVNSLGEIVSYDEMTDRRIINNSIPFQKDGKRYYLFIAPIKLKDKVVRHPILELFDSRPEEHEPFWGAVYKLFSAVNTGFRLLFTSLNPEFALTNPIRDGFDTLFNASRVREQMGLPSLHSAIMANVPKTLPTLLSAPWMDAPNTKMDEAYLEAMAHGLGMTWSNYEGVEKEIEKLGVNRGKVGLVRNLTAYTLSFASDVTEMMFRLATYKALIDQGISADKAAVAAKNISINFEKKGKDGRLINTLWLFANAGIQGSYNTYKTVTSKRGIALFTIMTGVFAANRLLLRSLMDDEDYGKWVNDYQATTNNFLVVNPLDLKNPLTIPKSYSMVRVGAAIGEGLVDIQSGYKSVPDVAAEIKMTSLTVFDPLGGVSGNAVSAFTPTLAKPYVEVLTNTSWANEKIKYFEYDHKAPMYLYYNISTADKKMLGIKFTDMAKALNEVGLEVSPTSLEYVMGQYWSGGLKFAERMVKTVQDVKNGDLNANNVPIMRRFYNSDKPKQYANILYNIVNRDPEWKFTDKQIEAGMNALVKAAAEGELTKDQYERVSDIVIHKLFLDSDTRVEIKAAKNKAKEVVREAIRKGFE